MSETKYLTNLFEESLLHHEIPIIFLKHLQKRNSLSNELLSFILPDLREIIMYKNYFLRYDLTLPFLLSNNIERAEYGLVYRIGPQSKYRQTEFIQADIDVVYSRDKVIEYFTFVIDYLKKLSLDFIIKYNHLFYLAQFANLPLNELKIWQKTIDRTDSTHLDVFSKQIEAKVVEEYGDLFLQPLFICTPSIVRGLHMYLGLVFEVYVKDLSYAVGAGGTYSIKSVKKETFFGISLGISRIHTYLRHNFQPIPILLFEHTFIKNSICIHLMNLLYYKIIVVKTNLKRIYQKFNKHKTIILLGKKELNNSSFRMKNLISSKQTVIPMCEFNKLWLNLEYIRIE